MTYTSVQESAVAGGGTQDRARWLMLTVLLAGQFMALLDVTIVNVAMPTIGRSLHASGAELQLVVAGYTVSYAMLLITGARLGDLIGRRRMFLLGVGVFTLASLTCGLAPDTGVLIGARFVQGAGAAAMMPQIMMVIQLRFNGAARVRALSAYTRTPTPASPGLGRRRPQAVMRSRQRLAWPLRGRYREAKRRGERNALAGT